VTSGAVLETDWRARPKSLIAQVQANTLGRTRTPHCDSDGDSPPISNPFPTPTPARTPNYDPRPDQSNAAVPARTRGVEGRLPTWRSRPARRAPRGGQIRQPRYRPLRASSRDFQRRSGVVQRERGKSWAHSGNRVPGTIGAARLRSRRGITEVLAPQIAETHIGGSAELRSGCLKEWKRLSRVDTASIRSVALAPRTSGGR
jgi:hypothetical protein